MALNNTESGNFLVHLHHLPDTTVSKLMPFSSLIMAVSLAFIALVRFPIERLLASVYGNIYTRLDEKQRRAFLNNHVASLIKFLLIAFAAYPVFALLITEPFQSPYAGPKTVTLGDVLLVCTNIFTSMYVFELFYRSEISLISIAHHVGAIVIAQTGLVLSEIRNHRGDGAPEFMMCLLWGLFDVLAEFWPHIAMIFKRTHYKNPKFISRVFMITCVAELISTVVETIFVFIIFRNLWDQWTLDLKVATPILHVLFCVAQIAGAKSFYGIHKEQAAEHEEEKRVDLSEADSVSSETTVGAETASVYVAN